MFEVAYQRRYKVDMFTGLIEEKGRVRRITQQGPGFTFQVEASAQMVRELVLGESVAIDGACMTVTYASGETFSFDASSESVKRTTLGQRRVGDAVHLERALRLGDRVGGHLVSGEVDGFGALVVTKSVGTAIWLRFKIESHLMGYLIEKGSIAIDGISLTVNELFDDGFSVMLIPHTQSVVHLQDKAVAEQVNIEVDQIGKYVERLLGLKSSETQSSSSGLSMEKLRALGFGMTREETIQSIERVEQAVQDIRNGRMVILVDDEDRENEGDLVMAAELAIQMR